MTNRRRFLRLCGVVAIGLVLRNAKLAVSKEISAPTALNSRVPVANGEERSVFDDEPLLHPATARRLSRELNRPTFVPPSYALLTAREAEVLILIARGLSKREIAETLVISEHRVGSHVNRLMHKTAWAFSG